MATMLVTVGRVLVVFAIGLILFSFIAPLKYHHAKESVYEGNFAGCTYKNGTTVCKWLNLAQLKASAEALPVLVGVYMALTCLALLFMCLGLACSCRIRQQKAGILCILGGLAFLCADGMHLIFRGQAMGWGYACRTLFVGFGAGLVGAILAVVSGAMFTPPRPGS